MAIALYLLAGFTDSFLVKLVIVGVPFSLPFITAFLLAFWWTRRRRNEAASRVLPIIAALLMFQLGILGTLFWYYVKDESINRASAERYEEASRKVQVGMTKAEVLDLIGAPSNINLGKGGEELWLWQSRHRWERPTIYKIIGKSPYQGGPFLMLSFDTSERVATVDTSRTWR